MTEAPLPEARRLLVDVHREQRARIWGFLLRATGSRETAEDLLQETFLRCWDHLEEEAPDAVDREGLRRLLWRIARNAAIDEIRERARRRFHPVEGGADVPSPAPGPHELAETEDCRRVVRETIGRLPNRRARRCLELWLDGLDVPGIARELGIERGQVRGLLQRGRSEVVLRAWNALRARGG